jgi:putative membrane-bound dehydrogenase-like protein
LGTLALALTLTLVGEVVARGQVGPEESARTLKPADGLEATLFAAEPMVLNPTTIDVDSRGRVWVTEGLNYRFTIRPGQGGMDRVEGADRIKVLEDTDGDGRADRMTVFADNLFPVPMGIAVEERWSDNGIYQGCRVFVGNSPDLLVLEDTDGDDKADRRYPLLTGFGGYDHDHGVHGMVLGLDGKLYFTQGDNTVDSTPGRRGGRSGVQFDVTDKSMRRVVNDQLAATLRVNRDGTQFEILADRQRNNYETCLNSFGDVFTSDNDDDGNRGSRVIWVMDGGRYGYRTSGSPRHWGEDVPGNVPKLVGTGNGSPCGVMVYEGDLLPEKYQGAVLEAEAGPRVIFAHPLIRKGAAFRTEPTVLLASDDPWFRPVDVTAAPDGSLFVADWYDAGVGGHAFRDQTTGRIYRVAPKGHPWKPQRANFATNTGLIAALLSPNVATRDVAQRNLLDRMRRSRQQPTDREGTRAAFELGRLVETGTAQRKARALWTLHQFYAEGGQTAPPIVLRALNDPDPRIRELAVRLLGRDCRENGQVAYDKAEAQRPAPALAHLAALRPLANDPDAGVRRELILASRAVPTAQVGDILRTLAASWDGQDRWYLEALGLALRHRESDYLAKLFDGTLYGNLRLERAGRESRVPLPPYFPIDRNEAYISANDPEPPPASALSKTLGLAWQVHRAEVLPLLAKIIPALQSPELQQAADDVIAQIDDPAAAVTLAELSSKLDDPVRRRQILTALARKLDGAWKAAATDPAVVTVIETAMAEPSTRAQGIAAAAATNDRRYLETLLTILEAPQSNPEDRAAAVEAVARLKPPQAADMLDRLIDQARERNASNPAAEAAVRSLPRLGDAGARLSQLIFDDATPLGLRRAAVRTLATLNDGGPRLLALARDGKLPEVLKGEATTVLYGHPDRRVRDQATRLLPLTSASGKPLPPIFDLIRRDGDVDRGRAVFFSAGTPQQAGGRQACGACHRVQGRGQWIGPDLSTIGTKYGKDELLRSILSPSAAIGYNYVTLVVALGDGQVITGLPVEDTPQRLVLKTADGRRLTIRPSDIDERATSEVSLMPEGLAQSLTEQELVDLLAYLNTLRKPVSVVGQFQATGPISDAVDPAKPTAGDRSWRRLTADAEGRVDLAPVAGVEAGQAAYLLTPIRSPIAQEAQLVLDSRANLRAWLGGRPLTLPDPAEDGTRTVAVTIPEGTTELLLRVSGGPDTALVATIVADRSVEFAGGDDAKVSTR